MNVYHMAYAPSVGTVDLHFWGCNFSCRACLLLKEIYDCHLEETKDAIFEAGKAAQPPQKFLALAEVMQILRKLEVKAAIFMGAEAAIDPQMPQLAETLHKDFGSYNILLTNGFRLADTSHIDEVVFSIKAVTDRLHRDYTGKSSKRVLENFIKLNKSGVKLQAESVFIPGYIDSSEIENIARFIAGVDRTIPYRVDPYLPAGDNPWRRPTPPEIEEAASLADKYLTTVSYLTGNEDLKFEVIKVF